MSQKARLTLLGLITVVGVVFVALRYAALGPLIGIRAPEVRLELTDAAGLTTQNEVSYRGVPVGDIGAVTSVQGGVEATIRLRRDSPPVPASSIAVVTDRSAIGEVYVDLRPERPDGPFLGDGSVIPRERTRLPVPAETAMAALDGIARTVPIPAYRRTIDELDAAFDHTGPDLGLLLDSSATLVAAARRNLPATTSLLHDGHTVLTSQVQLGPQFSSFSRDLATFTERLRRDDPSLRRLAARAPDTATQVQGVVDEVGPDLGRTLANLLTVTRLLEPRRAGIEQFLVTAPWGVGIGNTVLPGDHRLHFGIVLNLDDPPPCRKGYLQPEAGWRPATDTATAPLDPTVHCAEPPPVNPRGAQNLPGSRPPQPAPALSTTTFAPPADTPLADTTASAAPPVIVPGLER